MADYSNITGGLRIPAQIPLDVKTYSESELTLSDLGASNNLAFTYYDGLKVFCNEEQSTWIWSEVPIGEENTGLLSVDFTYPSGIIAFGLDYSNKKYNFFKVELSTTTTFVEEGDNITITGTGVENDPYIFTGLSSPFDTINDSYFPRNRDESQFGNIGLYSYDFSLAKIGADGDVYGQVGQIGIHPTEQYGALGESVYTFGYNLSGEGYGDTLFGQYNHSGTQSLFSTIFGRNNYNNSYHSIIGGSYNQAPYTYLGHKTIFGQGNVVNGTVGLTSGVALINKSFSTTVLGQANADYTNTSEGVNEATAPILIVGNGNVATPVGIWSATSRSNALKLLKNGLMTLPSVTNQLILDDLTGKAVVTKEYLETVFPDIPDGSETILQAGTNVSIIGNGTLTTPYIISANNDDVTQYTDELAQDAVGSILTNSDTIEFVYDDELNTITANLKGTANKFITQTGFSLDENVVTINADQVWLIDNVEYTNPTSLDLTLTYASTNNQKIVFIVPNNTNTFDIVEGVESELNPVAPTLEFPNLYLTFFLVTDGTVEDTVLPDYNSLYLKRYKTTYKTSQSYFNILPDQDDYNIIFIGSTNSEIRIFPNGTSGNYIKNGAIYPFKNRGTGIVSVWSGVGVTLNAPNGTILNPNEQCYLIKDDYNEWTLINPINLSTLSDFIPYTGATTDVDLGEFQLKAGQLELDQTPTGTFSTAKIRWNDTAGTAEIRLKGNNVTLQLGQELVKRVVNKTVSNITLQESAYQVVKIIGATGQRLSVDLAQANSEINSSTTLGLVTENISNNQEGFVTFSGEVNLINTTGSLQGETWVDGDVLYLSPTVAGALTKVAPTAPNHTVKVAYVQYAHITQGKLHVDVDTGYSIDNLHNVAITGITANKVIGSTTEGLWENKTIEQVLGYTPLSPSNIDDTIIEDSPNAVSGGAVFDALAIINTPIIIDGIIGVTPGFELSQQDFEIPENGVVIDVYINEGKQSKTTVDNTARVNRWSQTGTTLSITKVPVLNNYIYIEFIQT